MVYSQVQGEVVVGGVFLRLFINQPTWVLRKPKEFLIALLEKFGQMIQSTEPDVCENFLMRKCIVISVGVVENRLVIRVVL